MNYECKTCGVQAVVTLRFMEYRQCEICLGKQEAQIEALPKRWDLRMPVLYWGDYRAMVGRLGSTTAMARFLNVTPAKAKGMMKIDSKQRIGFAMLRRLFAPLHQKHASQWREILPTRCSLYLHNVLHRRSRERSSRGTSIETRRATSSVSP